MKEEEVVQILSGYRESLGACERARVGHRSSRRLLAIPAVAVAAFTGLLIWPRTSDAETLRHLGVAIGNAQTMESHGRFQKGNGPWSEGLSIYNDMDRWRLELAGTYRGALIEKDGLLYSDYARFPYATVGPLSSTDMKFPEPAEALEVVKDLVTKHFRSGPGLEWGSEIKIEDCPPVNGRGAYRLTINRAEKNRRIEFVVDRGTNLPIYSDTWFPTQHGHEDYQFNMRLPKELFEVPPGRKLVDLRKSIPAFLAAHPKPLAAANGVQVLDACATQDGTVWVATNGPKPNITLFHFVGAAGVRYAEGDLDGKLDAAREVFVHAYAPIEPGRIPRVASVEIRGTYTPRKQNPDPDTMPATALLGAVGSLSFPVRREPESVPPYVNTLGAEEDLINLPFNIAEAKARLLENSGEFKDGAKTYEQIGDENGPFGGGYASWMGDAARCYRKAGKEGEAKRVEAKVAGARSARP